MPRVYVICVLCQSFESLRLPVVLFYLAFLCAITPPPGQQTLPVSIETDSLAATHPVLSGIFKLLVPPRGDLHEACGSGYQAGPVAAFPDGFAGVSCVKASDHWPPSQTASIPMDPDEAGQTPEGWLPSQHCMSERSSPITGHLIFGKVHKQLGLQCRAKFQS